VNQGKSLSHIKIRQAYDFSLCFSHEFLMSFWSLSSIYNSYNATARYLGISLSSVHDKLNYFSPVTIQLFSACLIRNVFLGFLKSSRTYFHLSFLHGSRVPFPMPPTHSFPRSRPCLEIETIEVGVVTGFKPPSTLVWHSAVATTLIVISVVGSEFHSVVICQRITSITLDIKLP
jgi:hypothetical protein